MQYLLTLKTPWEFETTAASNLNDINGFYCTTYKFFVEIHGITRGKWIPGARQKLSLKEYNLTESERVEHDKFEYYFGNQALKKYVLFLIPKSKKSAIVKLKQNIWKRLKI